MKKAAQKLSLRWGGDIKTARAQCGKRLPFVHERSLPISQRLVVMVGWFEQNRPDHETTMK
ncbi:MAG TPA: hypothetical protein VNC39_06540 [Acidocella sp.]|uniref:hypothetical protein n=1 Tax=Acidocella sp. TaxID=50710 RepID=UPI002D1DFF5C|nr:hypothetical protein [Acidocella sp.]HVE21616.1 hypothetical protein [Acidocella sp.]